MLLSQRAAVAFHGFRYTGPGTADWDWLLGADEATVEDNVQAAAEGERRVQERIPTICSDDIKAGSYCLSRNDRQLSSFPGITDWDWLPGADEATVEDDVQAAREGERRSLSTVDFKAEGRDDTIQTIELEASVVLSPETDHARHIIHCHLDKCSSWRSDSVKIIIALFERYEISDETVTYAITLLDRFLAVNVDTDYKRQNQKSKISGGIWDKAECYAIACYLIATKFKDVCAPCIRDLYSIVQPTWPNEFVVQCEEDVLTSIDWALCANTGAARGELIPCTRLRGLWPHNMHLNFFVLPAFEIATELLRHPCLAAVSTSRKKIDLLLLLAHYHPDMLSHSCRDIALAAILTTLRMQGAGAGPLAPLARSSVIACAARMATLCSSQAMPSAGKPSNTI
jgi:hypothetical protein